MKNLTFLCSINQCLEIQAIKNVGKYTLRIGGQKSEVVCFFSNRVLICFNYLDNLYQY